jgi:hypothetical protein
VSNLDPDEIRAQLPEAPARGYDGARDDAPPDSIDYGRRKVIGWIPFSPDIDKAKACTIFTARGVRYDDVFATVRFWCAAVFE